MSFEKSEHPFDGQELKVGGRTLTVPALNLGAIKKLSKEFQLINPSVRAPDEVPDMAQFIDASVEIIFHALKRNYPEITKEEILDEVDMAQLPLLTQAVCGQSGVVSAEEAGGKGTPLGESGGGASTAG